MIDQAKLLGIGLSLGMVATGSAAWGQAGKKPASHPPVRVVKGATQLAGENALTASS